MINLREVDLDFYGLEDDDKVTFYPYRKARPANFIISLECNDDHISRDRIDILKENLLIKAGKTPKDKDNHVCFKIDKADGSSWSISFDDYSLIIGTGILVAEA